MTTLYILGKISSVQTSQPNFSSKYYCNYSENHMLPWPTSLQPYAFLATELFVKWMKTSLRLSSS